MNKGYFVSIKKMVIKKQHGKKVIQPMFNRNMMELGI
jgi:hypothetical protein